MIESFGRADLTPAASGSVVSIGVFDGVHLGHREILRRNVERARELDARATVITFRQHPKGLLLGHAPKTLTTLEHRIELFRRAGVGHTVVLDFDEQLRALSAERFVSEIAVEGLGVVAFVLGFDSKFGHDREGTPELCRRLGFEVEVVPKVLLGGRAVSSTAIREAVELGDLPMARSMLGRRMSVFGEVVRGMRLGHEIGFPTANLDLHHELHPPPGVYACRAHHVLGEGRVRTLDGVCNIGFRPTVQTAPAGTAQVEVHLFDFDGDLYGERLELEFVARLRGEQRFADLRELADQIAEDARQARRILAAENAAGD